MISVGVLGCGYFGRVQQEAWGRVEGARLVAVADRDAEARAQAPDGVAAEASLEGLLRPRPDVVDISVPPSAQAVAVRGALAAKPALIVCQKPFCTSPEEAYALMEEAEAAGVPLAVHENFRFMPWWRAIHAALPEIGEPLNATFRLRPGDGQGEEAYLVRQPYFREMPRFLIRETGVHLVDVFRFLLGDPGAVTADLRRLNLAIAGEDAAHVLMEHGAARSLLDANRLLDHDAPDMRRTMGEGAVEGTVGTLTLTGDGAVTLRRHGSRAVRTVLEARDWPAFGGDCARALQQHVADHLSKGAPLENAARDYLTVVEVETAIYRSSEEGRRISLARGPAPAR